MNENTAARSAEGPGAGPGDKGARPADEEGPRPRAAGAPASGINLAYPGDAAMNRGIRYRALSILLLGVLTSALSVMALVQLLSTSQAQRIERAREAVAEEVERLTRSPASIVEPPTFGTVGMRAGVVAGEPPAGLPEGWAAPLRAAADEGRRGGARLVREAPLGGGTLVLGVRPAAGPSPDAVTWAAVLVRPLPWLRAWQWIVSLLTAATALLVATSLYTVVTMTRGATALREALRALARDLGARVPRPALRELADIADGIARLAEELAAAREAEARLGAQLAANERLTALGRVAAGVAHEVRNPLASIKLRLDLAAAGVRLPEVAERAIAHASSEIARLDRLVADLLIVAGRAAGGRRDTDVGALVRARAEALAPWAEGRGVAVRATGEGRAAADPDSLARAVDNLLRNAVEASPAGGAVDVAGRARPGGGLVVRVDDAGPGVADAQAAALFEPFFTTKPGGTGLGLALSRAIARAHGGDLVYARRGDVSRFELSLALAPELPTAARPEEAA